MNCCLESTPVILTHFPHLPVQLGLYCGNAKKYIEKHKKFNILSNCNYSIIFDNTVLQISHKIIYYTVHLK
jgi:hypothetical protein